jgi:outer membrane protein assembly factor BamB
MADGSTGVNEQPFVWFVGERPPRAAISLTPMGHETLLICDGRSVRRLQHQVRDSVGQWVELNESYSADGQLAGRPLVHGKHIFVAKASGTVEVLDANNPAQVVHRWSLAGRPTSDLFVRAGHVLLVVGDHLLVSLTAAADSFADDPCWTKAAPTGSICGQPLAYGSSLIVADTGGTVCGLNIDNGEKIWETKLGPGQAPAAAPAVLADRFLVVPLVDGTLTLTPAPSAQRTEPLE